MIAHVSAWMYWIGIIVGVIFGLILAKYELRRRE
jgi:hypothetical protein